jgi:hypothetical protein
MEVFRRAVLGILRFHAGSIATEENRVDKKMAGQIVDFIESLNIEIFALKNLLLAPHGKRTKREIDAIVRQTMNDPDTQTVFAEVYAIHYFFKTTLNWL